MNRSSRSVKGLTLKRLLGSKLGVNGFGGASVMPSTKGKQFILEKYVFVLDSYESEGAIVLIF